MRARFVLKDVNPMADELTKTVSALRARLDMIGVRL